MGFTTTGSAISWEDRLPIDFKYSQGFEDYSLLQTYLLKGAILYKGGSDSKESACSGDPS